MRRILVVGLAAMLLTGCGGGGGGDTRPTGPPPTEPQPLEVTAVSTDMLMLFANSEPLRARASCGGSECSYSIDGAEVSTSSPSTGDRDFEPAGTRGGVRMGTSEASQQVLGLGTLTVRTYGGWMRYGSFAVSHGTVEGVQPETDREGARPEAVMLAVSLGETTGTNPLSGSATWTGAMAGKTETGTTIEGDAMLSVDFTRAAVDVSFREIADIDNAATYPDMDWPGLALRRGAFSRDGLQGRFHGPNHEEVSGVFERDRIVGGFVAGRDEN